MTNTLNRRSVLRGMMGGTAIAVGLPLLDIFLNTNGEAMADGGPLPKCFVSWFQGLGYAPGHWEPKTVGANYDFGTQLSALTPMKSKINIFSGMKIYMDAYPANAHASGPQGILQGGLAVPSLPSLDQIIADTVGTRTRFRSLEASCDGSSEAYSRRSATAINAPEPDPAKLYARIFGPDFKDPNAADFSPDPLVMARKSVLSTIKDKREKLVKHVGASDKARIDEYFTSLRALENRLSIELEKPAPLEACTVPQKVESLVTGRLISDARKTNELMAGLFAHAMACGQTQVGHLSFGGSLSNLRRAGSQQTFHMYTHEEQIDPVLGYQKEVAWFSNQAAEALLDFARAFEGIKEGKGTLLDRSLIMYSTDSGYAKTHSLENLTMMTVGSGGGALKTGIHVQAKGDTVTRVGLTIQQAMGVSVGDWGTQSNNTSKTITEIMA